MKRSKQRICIGCSQPFSGRSDAKTCSAKCRKRFQRGKALYQKILAANEKNSSYADRDYSLSQSRGGQYAG